MGSEREAPMWMRFAGVLLIAGLTISTAAQTGSDEPKKPMDWFVRARDQMNLRMPGAKPFHMKVRFHAFPGMEFKGMKEKSDIITGDGTYEETWVSANQWRREVWLKEYHAVEVESDKGRKMKADSDYEPSRVITLLDTLYNPIPRNLVSKNFGGSGASGWKIENVNNADIALVRISKRWGNQSGDMSDAFYFLPHGLLTFRNRVGLVTAWANYVSFGERVVPKHLSIKAGDRDLLSADISLEDAGTPDAAEFDLPVGLADPGMTLRPLQFYEVKVPDLSDSFSFVSHGLGGTTVFSMWAVLDKQGTFKEAEMLLPVNPQDADTIMAHMRGVKHHPAEIDGSPCQFVVTIGVL